MSRAVYTRAAAACHGLQLSTDVDVTRIGRPRRRPCTVAKASAPSRFDPGRAPRRHRCAFWDELPLQTARPLRRNILVVSGINLLCASRGRAMSGSANLSSCSSTAPARPARGWKRLFGHGRLFSCARAWRCLRRSDRAGPHGPVAIGSTVLQAPRRLRFREEISPRFDSERAAAIATALSETICQIRPRSTRHRHRWQDWPGATFGSSKSRPCAATNLVLDCPGDIRVLPQEHLRILTALTNALVTIAEPGTRLFDDRRP